MLRGEQRLGALIESTIVVNGNVGWKERCVWERTWREKDVWCLQTTHEANSAKSSSEAERGESIECNSEVVVRPDEGLINVWLHDIF